MKIETKRLILREYTEDDFQDLFELLSDPITMKYYPKPYDEEGTRRWINWCMNSYREHGFGLWAIVLKETNTFIGDCGISMQKIDGEWLPEIGYHIKKEYWRNGYANEAGIAVKEWGFANTHFEELYSYMTAANEPSYKTAASLGMTKIKEYYDEGELHFVYKIKK